MFDVETIVQAGGILAIALIVFAECGLLIGFFLPGDTLLLTAGVFSGQGKLSLTPLLISIILAAIIGYHVGYIFGEKAGPRMFKRKKGILLREEYVQWTADFFKKYGPIAVVAARFIAHVRTFVSVIAGAAKMDKRQYFIYNVVGALLWGGGLTLLGYWLGANVANIDRYLFPVIIASLIIIYVAAVWGLVKSPARRAAVRKGLREDFEYFFNGFKD